MDLDYVFEKLFRLFSYPDFGKKLGGEMPLFVQPFSPDKQSEAEVQIKRLISRLNRGGITTINVNLFDLTTEILKDRNILDPILENESEIPTSYMVDTMDSVLDISTVVIPKIQEVIKDNKPDFLFISGVGSVYPFIRSHGILNNIDELTDDCKIVLFFPGIYKDMQLNLFGKIFDENYYRGVNLDELNI